MMQTAAFISARYPVLRARPSTAQQRVYVTYITQGKLSVNQSLYRQSRSDPAEKSNNGAVGADGARVCKSDS